MEDIMSTIKLEEIFFEFLAHIRKKNFVLDEEEAKLPGMHLILAPQIYAAKKLLRAVFLKKRSVINLSIVRQLGKTELVALMVSFIFTKFFKVFKEPFRVVCIAPEKNTGLLIFERIVEYVPMGFFNKKQAGSVYRSKNGDSIEVFSMYDARVGGTYEGRTINLVVRDEAHLGDDKKYKDQIRPTMIRTNGTVINIGNGSWRNCLFTEGLEKGNTNEVLKIGQFEYEIENVVIKRTYDDLKEYMIGLAERGNRESASWVAGVEHDLQDGGRESLENRKNLFCEKILEKESFITVEEFDKCLVDVAPPMPEEIVGTLDIAKSGDRTIGLFGDLNYNLFDLKYLKEAHERKDILEQLDELVEYSDRRAYTERLIAFGGDSTGMGEAAVESLSTTMSMDIVPYHFSLQSKHQWYTELQTRILTPNEDRRLKIPRNLPHLHQMRKELTELTIKSSKNGECLIFAAPSGRNKFDDIPACLAMYTDLVGKISGYINGQDSYESRFPRKDKKPDVPVLIVPPREIRARAREVKNNSLVSGY